MNDELFSIEIPMEFMEMDYTLVTELVSNFFFLYRTYTYRDWDAGLLYEVAFLFFFLYFFSFLMSMHLEVICLFVHISSSSYSCNFHFISYHITSCRSYMHALNANLFLSSFIFDP